MSTEGPSSSGPATAAHRRGVVPTLVLGVGPFGQQVVDRLARLLARSGFGAPGDDDGALEGDATLADADDEAPTRQPRHEPVASAPTANAGGGQGRAPETPAPGEPPPRHNGEPHEGALRVAPRGGGARRLGRIVLLPLDATGPLAEPIEAAVAGAEGLLGLGELLRSSSGSVGTRPWLDVLLVADLADPTVGRVLPDIVRTLGARLLQRFSNIFPGHDWPNLTICPVVTLLGLRNTRGEREGPLPTGHPGTGPAEPAVGPAEALAALEAAATAVRFRTGTLSPVARVFVVEQQTSRYELTGAEVASTVVSLLALLLGTALRLEEPLRSFLRSPVDQTRDHRIFATFACATLELDVQAHAVCRAAAELVDTIRAAEAAAAGAESVAADRLVPDAEDLERRLCAPAAGDDLVTLLRAQEPQIPFPELGWNDTPEQVREVAYGWGWFDALESAVAAEVRELDEHVMDEVTRVADERGLAALRRLESEVRQQTTMAERSGPHGWAEGLRLAQQVRGRADRQLSAIGASLRKEKLPAFPKPVAVESAFRTLRDESTIRPRPTRLVFFGALATILLAALLQHVPKWLAVALVARRVPLLSMAPSSMDADVGAARFLLDPPWAIGWLLALFGVVTFVSLRRYRRRRHEALLAARDALKAAVRQYLADDIAPSVRRYYESRLRFTLRAWALRALRRARDVADAEVERLSAVSAALDRLSRKLHTEADEHAGGRGAGGGDLVYRRQLSPELVARSYEAVRPPADLAAQLFDTLEPTTRDDEPPGYLSEARLRRFVEPHVRHSEQTLGEFGGDAVERFVRQLHPALAVPLEVRGFDPRMAEQSYVLAPRWALERLEQLREELATLPAPLEHNDPDRIHLLTIQTALARDSIVLPHPPGADGAGAATDGDGREATP